MIDHIALVVEDPKRTATLLEKFGYKILRETPHHAGSIEIVDPKQESIVIELCIKRPQDSIGVDHICLKLEDQEAYQKLVDDGLSFKGELHLVPDSGRYVNNHVDEDNIKWQITI